MTNISKIFIGFIILTLTACTGGGRYERYYKPNSNAVPIDQAYLLKSGDKARMVFSENFQDDLKIFTDQNYAIIGESSFSGPVENLGKVQKFGKELGATHILLSANFAYSTSKPAYKFVRNDSVVVVPRTTRDHLGRYYEYETVYDNDAIPYRKEVPVFKQRAAFLIQLK